MSAARGGHLAGQTASFAQGRARVRVVATGTQPPARVMPSPRTAAACILMLTFGLGLLVQPAAAAKLRAKATRPPTVKLTRVGAVPVAGSPVRLHLRARLGRGSVIRLHTVSYGDGTRVRRGIRRPRALRHTYRRAGRYRVTLRVIDNRRRRSVGRLWITVRARGRAAVVPTTRTPAEAPPPTPAEAPIAPDGTCAIDPPDGQAAIAAAIGRCPNGATVSFPAGRTYHQTDAISIERRSGLTIDGNGSTFVKTNPGVDSVGRPQWRILEGDNVTLEDMSIEGSLPPGPRGITPGNQYDHGVYILGGTGHTVRDVTVRHVFGDFVTVAPSGLYLFHDATKGLLSRDVLVQRVTGTSAARMCIALTGGIGIRVEDSVLADCRYAGIDLETDAVGEKLQDVHILRNQISGYYLFAIGVAGPAYAPPNPGDIDNIEIRGNTTLTASDTCWEAIHAERGPFSNLVVAENPMLKSLGDGIELYDVTSGSVSGNTMQLTASPLLCNTPSIPVRLHASPNVTVAGNTASGY